MAHLTAVYRPDLSQPAHKLRRLLKQRAVDKNADLNAFWGILWHRFC